LSARLRTAGSEHFRVTLNEKIVPTDDHGDAGDQGKDVFGC
jgi:hypothetical protein